MVIITVPSFIYRYLADLKSQKMKQSFLLYSLILILNAALGQEGLIEVTFNPGDKGFGKGDGANGIITMVEELEDGKLAIIGRFTHYDGHYSNTLCILEEDGSVYAQYNSTGVSLGLEERIESFTPLPNKRILIAGYFNNYNEKPARDICVIDYEGKVQQEFIRSGVPVRVSNTSRWNDSLYILSGPNFNSYNGVNTKGIVVVRSDGTHDVSSFKLDPAINWIAEVNRAEGLSNGKVLAIGRFEDHDTGKLGSLMRFHPDGRIDSSFYKSPEAQTISKFDVQSDGKILISGFIFTYQGVKAHNFTRIHPNGELDTIFNTNTSSILSGMKVHKELSNGQIIIGNSYSSNSGQNSLFLLNADGTVDSSFSFKDRPRGTVYSVSETRDGNIVVTGDFTQCGDHYKNHIAKYTLKGELVQNFNLNSGFNGTVKTLAEDHMHRILVGGDFTKYNQMQSPYLVKIDSLGKQDTSFHSGSGPNGAINDLLTDFDHAIYLGGTFMQYNDTARSGLAKLHSNGVLDSSFNIGSGFNGHVNSLQIQPDGKLLVGGTFTQYQNHAVSKLCRINPDGTLDTTFKTKVFNDSVNAVCLQRNGHVLVGGAFTKYDGATYNRIIRLKADGSVDSTFDAGTGANYIVEGITLQRGGGIIVNGQFSAFNGSSSKYLVRLHRDGNIDATFNIGSGSNTPINAVLVQDDGKLIIGGKFTQYQGQTVNRILRLNADGSRDFSFGVGTGFKGLTNEPCMVNELIALENGGVLAGGDFTSYSNYGRNRIAKIKANKPSSDCKMRLRFVGKTKFSCEDTMIQVIARGFNGTPYYNYEWIGADSTYKDSIAFFRDGGVFKCIVNDEFECADTASLLIEKNPFSTQYDYHTNLVLKEFRTGFENTLSIISSNRGCDTLIDSLYLVLDPLVEYIEAHPAPARQAGDTLWWSHKGLAFETHQVIELKYRTSLLAAIGDTVKLKVNITPFDVDEDTTNNERTFIAPIINGYDPNDIAVNPVGRCDEGYVNPKQILTYRIRFQNTGNAEAIHINVVDSLDSDLDLNTLKVLASSDSMYTLIYPGNVVKFVFDSIMLADSTHDEPNSHGYVIYEIQAKSGVSDNIIIQNRADIYFDFNPAVLTNTISNTIHSNSETIICEPTLVTQAQSRITIFPNPSTGLLSIRATDPIEEIRVMDQMGRQHTIARPNLTQLQIDLGSSSSGLYFFEIRSAIGTQVFKVLIQK